MTGTGQNPTWKIGPISAIQFGKNSEQIPIRSEWFRADPLRSGGLRERPPWQSIRTGPRTTDGAILWKEGRWWFRSRCKPATDKEALMRATEGKPRPRKCKGVERRRVLNRKGKPKYSWTFSAIKWSRLAACWWDIGWRARCGRNLEMRVWTMMRRITVRGKRWGEGGNEKLRTRSRRAENWRWGLLTGTWRKVVWDVMIGTSCQVRKPDWGSE